MLNCWNSSICNSLFSIENDDNGDDDDENDGDLWL